MTTKKQVINNKQKDMTFADDVYLAVKDIPVGKVVTYGDIATYIGCAGAARAVGTALKNNPTPIIVPCHRVVPETLELGRYKGGISDEKRTLLQSEGVLFTIGGRVHPSCRFRLF